MKKIIKKFFVALLVVVAGFVLVLAALFALIPDPAAPKETMFGVTFSKPFAEKLGLDWKEAYMAILDGLGIKNIRLIAYWPEVERQEGKFDFADLDWQVAQAKARNIGVMLSVGQKLPRWPECHYPSWLPGRIDDQRKPLSRNEQKALLAYIQKVVERYKDEPAVASWQVENEPFLPFGICPALDPQFLDAEIALVRATDASRSIVISESGEFSTWRGAAARADIVGSTLYRVVWWKSIGYVHYPIPEWFYWKKTSLIKWLYPSVKDIIVIELQGEPWAHLQIYENTLQEMMKSMPPEQFIENLRYARESRFAIQYVWGAEWWYWMKVKKDISFYWDYARRTFNE